ncbi:MAG: RIP metalloprotease RseP [Verrucomicrobiota bacterium]
MSTFLHAALLVLVIITCFNVIIFVHELGHFLAARWRGLKVEKFYIWFGKPLWKKKINGVEYGLGSLPFGGYVALPQMAPMEAIEGRSDASEPLPPISALDKIIVAFAGPLFSMLLALAAALVVWQVGKPKDFVATNQIGYVEKGGPAAKAGLLPGDRIIAINGEKVNGFGGSLDSIAERIILSRGNELRFLIERPGIPDRMEITTGFETEKTQWWQRRALRQIGIDPAGTATIEKVFPHSPAAEAGIKAGDRIVSIDDTPLFSPAQFHLRLQETNGKPVNLRVQSPGGATREVVITPEVPESPAGEKPMAGFLWGDTVDLDTRIVHPGPFEQVGDSLEMMWVTITSVISPQSSIGIDHLSGPVGIAQLQWLLLQTEDGWRRLLSFFVLFNVNLAVLNMLPFPVLDGGHITLAVLEKLAGRPVKAKPLEIIQTACALLLIGLMLFVTSKDVGDLFGRGGKEPPDPVFSKG